MMYSQKDPLLKGLSLGPVTIGSHGCLLVSLANLYQIDPIELLGIKKAITWNGEADTKALAKFCGGEALPKTKTPLAGWCIAMTDHYKKVFPTHFFCYNHDTKEMIDPLVYPAVRQPCTYKIIEYRPFTNVKLDFTREDLEKRLKLAESALDRVTGPRKTALGRFIERVKLFLS